ncbi:MAG: GntR family transcriptional regulator [Bacilli bacterium]|jgi:GntR family transcriptional regulator|nr:GntR family transcriptional regulator [Acholeplasmataceae bacterium]HPX20279.1 GntR family transcriptional regulator [Bacilli bacterium]
MEAKKLDNQVETHKNGLSMYQIIEQDIKYRIEEGILRNGDMIESENVLKEMYNVSRMTVRQALNNLVRDGYLYRHKGKGTFVNCDKLEKKIYGLVGFSEEMRRLNRVPSSKVISFELITPDDKLKDKLALTTNEQVYFIRRVRYGDNMPVLLEHMYIPSSLFKDLNEQVFESSFYDYVEKKCNYRISYCNQKLEAKIMDEEQAKILEAQPGSALLYCSSITYLDNGRPFEYVRSFYRGDQYRFIHRALRN